MYRAIDDFLEDFDQENESTRKVLAALTDASLQQKLDMMAQFGENVIAPLRARQDRAR